MNRSGAVLAIIATALSSASCSNTAANKRTFKAAIRAELANDPACVWVPLPQEKPKINGQATDSVVDALARIGLVKRIDVMLQASRWDPILRDYRVDQEPGVKYEVTDAGKTYYRNDPIRGPQLCYGSRKLVDIVEFTGPFPATGGAGRVVTYTWKLTDVADWAKDPGLQKVFPRLRKLISNKIPHEDEMTLILSKNGWHAPHPFSQQ